jgi:hypothetical protein
VNLDHDLRCAFRRKPAPRDFADRVLARLAQPDVATTVASPSPRRPAVHWLAAAAAIAVVAIGGARYYIEQQTVAEAERVQKEVRAALQIAGEKLALVQRKLRESQR